MQDHLHYLKEIYPYYQYRHVTELYTKHLYQLNTTNDLPSGIIPLAVDNKIDLNIELNIGHSSIHVSRRNHRRKITNNRKGRY